MASPEDVVIVGGGISGLSALHFLRHNNPEIKVRLLEADSRLGGTIGTDHIDGYSLDRGPNGFLDREPLTLQLVHELDLDDQLEPANDNSFNRFILRKNRLRALPMSPPKFLISDILSLRGKLRLMMEPFASSPREGVDESVYDFGCRRIGREATDYLIQPMVSGVYGGMADRLSLNSCFPIMREMEQEHGSLFKAMISKSREAKGKGRKSGGPAGPGGHLTSFHGGLYRLIERLAERYKDNIVTGSPVTTITNDGSRFVVHIHGSGTIPAINVVLALPANRASDITRELSPALSDALGSIEYAPVAVVCLGYDERSIKRKLDGFGFLVPQKENKRILGSIWTSSIFAGRAPQGKVQLRCMLGGDGDHLSASLSDEGLLAAVEKDLNEIIGLSGSPELVKIYRFEKGIPQFRIGHGETVAKIERSLTDLGNVYVTGNAYYGIGLNDCVKQSYKVAERICAQVA